MRCSTAEANSPWYCASTARARRYGMRYRRLPPRRSPKYCTSSVARSISCARTNVSVRCHKVSCVVYIELTVSELLCYSRVELIGFLRTRKHDKERQKEARGAGPTSPRAGAQHAK